VTDTSLNTTSSDSLPAILAGPILRKLTPQQGVIWLATSAPFTVRFVLRDGHEVLLNQPLDDTCCTTVQVGERAYISLIDLTFSTPLPQGRTLHYDLRLDTDSGEQGLADLMPWLVYEGEGSPSLVCKMQLNSVLHGSCRKPHYASDDALVRADTVLMDTERRDAQQRPALLMMSGDQIYADDVAGPMLGAIHQVVERLGLWPEQLEGAQVSDSAGLYASDKCYYHRAELLPADRASAAMVDRMFAGARKPIFTSDSADNHLITLAEVLAMYLLVWSPQLWADLSLELSKDQVPDGQLDSYIEEQNAIRHFVEGLPQVQRLLAHLPTYMIFDDHDVTDDWNLTRGWEETAYGHPFSKRIIGNTLIGYWLCQGWGNAPERFDDAFMAQTLGFFKQPDDSNQKALIDHLLGFEQWHYSLDTQPKMVVLDTRTRRWRSESSAGKPSGLMDWEALTELQQELINQPAVIIVSPAPIYGVKLIEIVQKIFTWFGKALTVDAENWMAHPGSANVILNIFQHARTPQNFVVLSGDVHYSFAYDIRIRSRKSSPSIWQITCSGLKNEFPHTLLNLFDQINIALFGSKSPLNFFTRRRRMKLKARKPQGSDDKRLHNGSGIGLLELDRDGRPTLIRVLGADGSDVDFISQVSEKTPHRLH